MAEKNTEKAITASARISESRRTVASKPLSSAPWALSHTMRYTAPMGTSKYMMGTLA